MALLYFQEKDPSAAEPFAAANAFKQQSMQSAAGDQAAAHAVDGFVPRIRHTNAVGNAPIAQKGPHIQQHRNQQVTPDSRSTAFTQSVTPPPL